MVEKRYSIIRTEALAVTYGLASALNLGGSDFSGGFASKTTSALSVIFYFQLMGFGMALLATRLFSVTSACDRILKTIPSQGA